MHNDCKVQAIVHMTATGALQYKLTCVLFLAQADHLGWGLSAMSKWIVEPASQWQFDMQHWF